MATLEPDYSFDDCCNNLWWCDGEGNVVESFQKPAEGYTGPYRTRDLAVAECPATIELDCCPSLTNLVELPATFVFEWDLDYGIQCTAMCGGMPTLDLGFTRRYSYTTLGPGPYALGFAHVEMPIEFTHSDTPAVWVEMLAETPLVLNLDYSCQTDMVGVGDGTVLSFFYGNTGVGCGSSGINLLPPPNSGLWGIYHYTNVSFGVVRCTPESASDFAVFPGSEVFTHPGFPPTVVDGWIVGTLSYFIDEAGCNGAVVRTLQYRFKVYAV